ncbi:chaperone protein DnaJ 49-like protein [Tanacetum coccineum]|uniref:Chaperone protein DnaJ 49-like protein n=1 Tax=Tanacetum coccineum TaxID=301880 RepID=A0ABQ5DSS3_9ASTR
MDGNKDEALKCLQIGKDALGLGDRVKALKFITKAKRLDPLLQIDDLLKNLDENNGFSNSPENAAGDGAGEGSGGRSKVSGNGSGRVNGLGNGSSLGTNEQMTIVWEIRRKKDYYDILGVSKDCGVEDIRKAYRKLSLKVHPDKNKAPGSEEAFKKVSKAFKCLSDAESRKKYNVMGSEEPMSYMPPARRRGSQNGFFYEGDVDAEEVFRNFFFGGMNPRATTQFSGFNFGNGTRARTQTQTGNTNNGGDGFNIRALLQLLPVLLILYLSFFSSSNDPVYSLSRTYSYQHRLLTQKGVPFFVKSRNFEQTFPLNSDERVQLEGRIEDEYLSILSHNCWMERQRFNWGIQPPTPNCDMLKKFQEGLVS